MTRLIVPEMGAAKIAACVCEATAKTARRSASDTNGLAASWTAISAIASSSDNLLQTRSNAVGSFVAAVNQFNLQLLDQRRKFALEDGPIAFSNGHHDAANQAALPQPGCSVIPERFSGQSWQTVCFDAIRNDDRCRQPAR